MKKSACFLIACLLMLLCGSASAKNYYREYDVSYIAQGETRQVEFDDYSSTIFPGSTKEDYTITYTLQDGKDYLSVTKDGLLTASPTAVRQQYSMIISYSSSVSGKYKTDYVFTTVRVCAPLTEMTLEEPALELSVKEEKTLELHLTEGANSRFELCDYDSSIVDIQPQMGIYEREKERCSEWELTFTGKAAGTTNLKIVAYNGLTVELPITVCKEPTSLTFGATSYDCYVGDSVDLQVIKDGNPKDIPSVEIERNGGNTSTDGYFPEKWDRFYAFRPGIYDITMTTWNNVSNTVRVNAYSRERCEEIRISPEVPVRGYHYLVVATACSASGEEVVVPLAVTKGQNVVEHDERTGRLTILGTGQVELTAYNTDGTTTTREFEIYERPSTFAVQIPKTELQIGEAVEVGVTFDKGRSDYYLACELAESTPYDLPPLRIEGKKIIAQAPGTMVVKVNVDTGGTQEITIHVPYSENAVWIAKPSGDFNVGDEFQLTVHDDAGNQYPAQYRVYSGQSACISLTQTGLMKGKIAGSVVIEATLKDGRVLRYTQKITKIPRQYISHPAIVMANGSYASFGTTDSDAGPLTRSDLQVAIADESVVTLSGDRFKALKVGTTHVTLTEPHSGLQTTFTVTVLKSSDTQYMGYADMEVPCGFAALLPTVNDTNGNPLKMTWTITWQVPGNGNPEATGFYIDNNESIACTWPTAHCEVTGKASNGKWVKINVGGYQIPDAINIPRDYWGFYTDSSKQVTLFDAAPRGYKFGPVIAVTDDEELCQIEIEGNGQNLYTYVHTFQKEGTTLAGVFLANGAFDLCQIKVVPKRELILPAKLKAIEDEAFMGTQFTAVSLKGVTHIGARAFKGCDSLVEVKFMDQRVTHIADDAFDDCPYVVFDINTSNYSYLVEYAEAHGIPYE